MALERYYSTQRPIVPGAIPRPYGSWGDIKIDNIKNFDERIWVPEIGRMAWGYVEYTGKIPENEADDYELVWLGKKPQKS